MIDQCCCGRITPAPSEPERINDIVHEAYGKEGAFCGPWWKHELRDLRAALDFERNDPRGLTSLHEYACVERDRLRAELAERDRIIVAMRQYMEKCTAEHRLEPSHPNDVAAAFDNVNAWLEDALALTPDSLVGMRLVPVEDRISRDRDIILEAINEYDQWMQDDDYDAQACLQRIIARMRDRAMIGEDNG